MASSNVVQFSTKTNTSSINVRELLLSGQCDPSIKLPAEIQKAIDKKAREMAQEAFELCREHLARRVAYTSVMGNPRAVVKRRALDAINRGDLGEALAHEYFRKLRHCARSADSAAAMAADFLDEINEVVKAGEYSND